MDIQNAKRVRLMELSEIEPGKWFRRCSDEDVYMRITARGCETPGKIWTVNLATGETVIMDRAEAIISVRPVGVSASYVIHTEDYYG